MSTTTNVISNGYKSVQVVTRKFIPSAGDIDTAQQVTQKQQLVTISVTMAFLSEIRCHKVRFVKVFVIWALIFVYGLGQGMYGPTLTNLKIQVSTAFSNVAYILPCRSLGIIIGSSVGGVLYPRVNWFFTQAWSSCLMSLAILYIPFSSSFIALMADMFANGAVGGVMLTGSNVHILDLWGKESGPFMQIGQFAFGLGALCGPLIASPFLLPIDESSHRESSNLTNLINEEINFNVTSDLKEMDEVDPGGTYPLPSDVNLVVPYSIITVLGVACSIFSLILSRTHPVLKTHPSREVIKDNSSDCENKDGQLTTSEDILVEEKRFRTWRIVVIILASLFMPLYYGVEVAYGSYVSAFVQYSDLKMDQNTAAYISSVYWCTFTFFRLFAAFYIEWIGPEMNIFLSLIVMVSANIVMVPFGESYPVAIWIATVLAGIGTSSVWASVFGCLENYFPVTSTITAGMLSATFVGDCVLPVILSNQIEIYPKIFMWIYLASSVTMAILFCVMIFICRKKLKSDTINRVKRSSVSHVH